MCWPNVIWPNCFFLFLPKELEQQSNPFLLDMFPSLKNYLLKNIHILLICLFVIGHLADKDFVSKAWQKTCQSINCRQTWVMTMLTTHCGGQMSVSPIVSLPNELEQLLNHFLLDMFPSLNNYLLKINHILVSHLLVKSKLVDRHFVNTA